MKRLSFGVLALGILGLSGCDSVRNTLGLDHYQADAFSTPTNPPLTIPPDYNLAPPTPGAPPTNARPAQTQAQQTLNTHNAQVYSGNESEAKLLLSTGQSAVTPNIREVVNKESTEDGTFSGKVEGQLNKWGKEAKENFNSIKTGKKADTDSPSPPSKEE